MLQWEVRMHLLAKVKRQPKDRSSTTQAIIEKSVGLKRFFLPPLDLHPCPKPAPRAADKNNNESKGLAPRDGVTGAHELGSQTNGGPS